MRERDVCGMIIAAVAVLALETVAVLHPVGPAMATEPTFSLFSLTRPSPAVPQWSGEKRWAPLGYPQVLTWETTNLPNLTFHWTNESPPPSGRWNPSTGYILSATVLAGLETYSPGWPSELEAQATTWRMIAQEYLWIGTGTPEAWYCWQNEAEIRLVVTPADPPERNPLATAEIATGSGPNMETYGRLRHRSSWAETLDGYYNERAWSQGSAPGDNVTLRCLPERITVRASASATMTVNRRGLSGPDAECRSLVWVSQTVIFR